ncbi:MAG: hypothetical protein A2Z44_03195 [Betaproteobacteria bacterium RBG_19FT_COMBO_58_11]|nr:MAG: hypothetical protein A2Z44_03195 [Betaproteobacteria bacterium RBG_19FT_COMBO_58_11]
MKPIYLHPLVSPLIVALLLTMSARTSAEGMYKHVDEQGRVTYSNTPIKGGKKVDLPPLSTLPTPKAAPKPTPQAEAVPDKESRHKTLQEQIAKTEKALEAAKAAAKEGAEKPEVFTHTKTVIGKDGKPKKVTETGRNVVAYEEKMKKLNDEVALHEKNLEKLKAELAGLDGKKPSDSKEEKK